MKLARDISMHKIGAWEGRGEKVCVREKEGKNNNEERNTHKHTHTHTHIHTHTNTHTHNLYRVHEREKSFVF